MGTPMFFMGASAVVAAFFGYFFELLQKSDSPAVRIPQCLTKSNPVNIIKKQITNYS